MAIWQSKIFKNSLFKSGSYFISVLIAFVTTPLFVAKLGIEGYGVYILLTSLVGYYNLLDLGFNQGVTKFVAEFKEKKDFEAVNRSINAAVSVQLFIGLITSALFISFATFIIHFLKINPSFEHQARYGIYACSIGFLLSMISSTLDAALAGLFRYDLSAKIESSINVSMNLCLLVLVIAGCNLLTIIYVNVFFAFASVVVNFLVVKQQLPTLHITFNFDKIYFNKIFKFSSFIMLSRVSGVFSNYIVRFVVSYFLGPAAVALYVVPSKLLAAFGGLLSSASNVVFPLASQLNVSDSSEKIKELFYKSARLFSAISVPVMLFIIVFSRQILKLWMGNDFAMSSHLVLSVLTLGSLIGAQSTMPNLIITGLGHSKLIGFFGLLAIGCYCIFLPVGTKYFGVLGTSWGMLLTTLVNIYFVFYFTSRKVNVNLKRYLNESFSIHLLPVLIAVLLFFINDHFIQYSLQMLGLGIVLLGVYFLAMIKTGFLPLKLK